MPTYEYLCPEGHAFEKVQKISGKPRAKCPVCGKPAVRQISGGAALVFKGSGFYITDYGKDGKGARKPEESTEKVEKPAPSTAEGTAKTEKTEKSDKSEKKEAKPASADKPATTPAPSRSEGKAKE